MSLQKIIKDIDRSIISLRLKLHAISNICKSDSLIPHVDWWSNWLSAIEDFHIFVDVWFFINLFYFGNFINIAGSCVDSDLLILNFVRIGIENWCNITDQILIISFKEITLSHDAKGCRCIITI